MDRIFLTILNMSLTGAFVIAAICLARLPLKKAPKAISYALWAVAGFRLVFPWTMESVLSLIPFRAAPIPSDIAWQAIPRIDSGIPFVDNAVSAILPAATPYYSANPMQIWTAIGAWVWIIGAALMVLYGVASYFRLKHKMASSIRVEDSIYETDAITSPFVLGVFKPKIYLPLGLSAQERSYIILHEQTHIKRRDHIVKFAAYFVLCLHWFNPLAWAAFLLMGVDMEMSCDERVLREMGNETKKDYSLSLLSLAANRRLIGGSPLAFSEGGLKARIKNVLNFRKPSRVIVTLAVALVAVLSVGFAFNQAGMDRPGFDIPCFQAGGMTLGAHIDDMDLSQWHDLRYEEHVLSHYDFVSRFSSFSVNEEGRIYRFSVFPSLLTEGIWTMSGIEPRDRFVNNYMFGLPTMIDDILGRFGEGTPHRSNAEANDPNALIYMDNRSNIYVIVFYDSESRQVLSIHAGFQDAENIPPLTSHPTPAPASTQSPMAVPTPSAAQHPDNPGMFRARGIDGTEGYIYHSDLNADAPNNPEEAMAYMAWLEERFEEMRRTGEQFVRVIPLYAADGVTVIGEYGIGSLPPPEIMLMVSNTTPGGLSYSIFSTTNREFIYNRGYELFVMENGAWEPVKPIIEHVGFHDIAYRITARSMFTAVYEVIDWRWAYGELPDGQYMIRMYPFYHRGPGDNDQYVVETEFTIPTFSTVVSRETGGVIVIDPNTNAPPRYGG